MNRYFSYFIAFILLISATACTGQTAGLEENFHEANKFHSEGRYADAEAAYKKILEDGDGASARNNLGQALFRQGRLGEAIFNFMKAQQLSPRNADISYNLTYARNRITDSINRKAPHIAVTPFFILEQKLSLKDSWAVFAFSSILFWALAAFFLLVRRDWIKWLLLSFGVVFIINSAILIKKEIFNRPFGVVTNGEAEIYSTPENGGVLLFKIHEGADFTVIDDAKENWLRIELPDGKRGWIDRKNVIFCLSHR